MKRTALILLALMVASSVFAVAIKPTTKLADLERREKLATLVPMNFGDWRGVDADSLVVADPQMLRNLQTIYTETLSRTYVDSKGRRIMLSIAYGDDQRDGMNVHYPEVCYPAQGFQQKAANQAEIRTTYGMIHANRLLMTAGSRIEPITYWTMVGQYQSGKGLKKKANEMRYSLDGIIPDGMLVRLSSMSADTEAAYTTHDEFIDAMLHALNPEARNRIAGLQGSR
jgi:EpsI family protein